jgi:hypothetical protein
VAIAGGDAEVVHPVHLRGGLQVQHGAADVVKLACLGRCHRRHRGAACAFNALDQAARGGIQQGSGVGVVAAHGALKGEFGVANVTVKGTGKLVKDDSCIKMGFDRTTPCSAVLSWSNRSL